MTFFLKNIEAEADAVARFVELLKQEQEALNSGDIERLDALLQRKDEVTTEQGELAAHRNSWLAAGGFGVGRAGVEAWLALHPAAPLAQQAWSQVLSLAEKARELNRINGEIIQMRMLHNAQALEVLLGTSRQPNLYGPNGQSATQNSRRINDAA